MQVGHHWNGNIVIVTTISSLAAKEIVTLIICVAGNDENDAKLQQFCVKEDSTIEHHYIDIWVSNCEIMVMNCETIRAQGLLTWLNINRYHFYKSLSTDK